MIGAKNYGYRSSSFLLNWVSHLVYELGPTNTFNDRWYIPVAFQSATLLAALAHPDHLLL
ncbi:MAG: hypothetical protein QS721_11985 [Candidatus Endonucleobacter sp. (ex Gigantidas childressi)]|nr:hypothetical protein [Candidatus Endonucleobacter sp. (ex Gigantidas childressi)]